MSEPVIDCPPAPIKLSWSRLKAYESCRHRVKLQKEGHRSPITDGRNFLPGTIADRAMRMWLEEGKFDSGGMEKFIPEIWEKHTGKDSEYKIKWRGNPRDDQREIIERTLAGLKVLEPILFEKVVPYEFMPEYRFTSTMGIPDLWGGVTVIEIFGAVDVAVKMDEERYGLYDLKITENQSYIRSTLAQLVFYDRAFKGYTGLNPVEHAFWAPMLPLAESPGPAVIPVTVTENERRQMVSRIINYAHGVWRNEWELTADENECFNCPVKHACPRFKTFITTDDQGRHRASFNRPTYKTMEKKDAE